MSARISMSVVVVALSLAACAVPDRPVVELGKPAPAGEVPVWQAALAGDDAYFRVVSRLVDGSGLRQLQDICQEDVFSKTFSKKTRTYSLLTYVEQARAELPLLLVTASNSGSADKPCTVTASNHPLTPWMLLPRPPRDPIQLSYHSAYSQADEIDIRPIARTLATAGSFFTSGGNLLLVAVEKVAADDRVRSLQDAINTQLAAAFDERSPLADVGPHAGGVRANSSVALDVVRTTPRRLILAQVSLVIEFRQSLLADTDPATRLPSYPDAINILEAQALGDPDKYKTIEAYLNEGDFTGANITNSLRRVAQQGDLESACTRINRWARQASLSRYDALAVKWAALVRNVPNWSSTEVYFDDKYCFSDTDRELMARMKLSLPRPAPRPQS